jgi:hypothetical protein
MKCYRKISLRGRNFLGNENAENYSEIAQDLISSYCALGFNVSMELHFLHTHLDPPPPPENKGTVSDEHGERRHQNTSQMEKRYSEEWIPDKLAYYYWSLTMGKPTGEYKR